MTYQRYPHTATIGWYAVGTVNTIGYYTKGTLNTIWGYCNIQETRAPAYLKGRGGDIIERHYDIFWHRRLNTTFATTQGVFVGFNGATYPVLEIINHVKHTEIQI